MRETKSQKAYRLYNTGKVILKSITPNAIYFDVLDGKVRDVYYVKNRDHWSCDPCKYYSLTTKDCSHILACKLYLKRMEKLK